MQNFYTSMTNYANVPKISEQKYVPYYIFLIEALSSAKRILRATDFKKKPNQQFLHDGKNTIFFIKSNYIITPQSMYTS